MENRALRHLNLAGNRVGAAGAAALAAALAAVGGETAAVKASQEDK